MRKSSVGNAISLPEPGSLIRYGAAKNKRRSRDVVVFQPFDISPWLLERPQINSAAGPPVQGGFIIFIFSI